MKVSGIITKDATISIGAGLPNTTRPTVNNSSQSNQFQSRVKGQGPRNPGPPMGPAPSHQPQNRPAVNLNKIRQNSVQKKQVGPIDMSVLNVPEGGRSQSIRQSMAVTDSPRPVPGGGRPRPKPRAVKKLPQVKALWEYQGQDLDEISFEEGDTFDLIAEDDSGWWKGTINGKTGFFPGSYVEKI